MKLWRDNSQAYGWGLAILSFPVALYFLSSTKPFNGGFGYFCATLGAFGMLGAGLAAYEATRRFENLPLRVALLTFATFGPAFLVATAMFILFPPAWIITAATVSILWAPCIAVIAAWSTLYLAAFGPVGVARPEGYWGSTLWLVASALTSAAFLFFTIKLTYFK